MADETPEERQNNEFAVLQAIFGDDVVDNREHTAWKVWKPLDLLLTLHPHHNSNIQGDNCYVTLHIKCCAQYPDKPPSILLKKVHGLSTENGIKLLSELETLAKQHCGEVMIFVLSQHVQEFLHDHYKPVLSFYEEMLKQKENEQLKLQDLQIQENEERQKIRSEIEKRKEMLRDAKRKVRRSTSTSQENSNDGQDDVPELIYYADVKVSPNKKDHKHKRTTICTCDFKTQMLRITQKNNKKVYIGNCLGHSSNGATTYLALDDETGDGLVSKKWIIPPASDFQTRNNQQTSLQQDLKTMCRLNHSTLVPYIFTESLKETKLHQTIFIFRAFVHGCSLKYLLNKCRYSDQFEALKLLRTVGLGVFGALQELHSVGILHRDVRCENVFLDNFGGAKLVGAALDARLVEMLEGDSFCSKQTQSQDIYAAAQLLLSIVTNEATVREVPSDLPSAAKDFFSRCLTDDEHSQWSAQQLVNHGFLVDGPTKQVSDKKKNGVGSGSEDDEDVKKIPQVGPPLDRHSRLNEEFEVLDYLGKGAFGDVLKVKNKLDGGFYAIKLIKLNPENVKLNKKITREVKLLSRLNHENVVRYYNAWIESTVESNETVETSIVKTPDIRKKPADSLLGVIAKLGQDVKVGWSMSENVAQKTTSDSEEDDDYGPEDETSSDIEFEVNSQDSNTIPSDDMIDAPRPQSVRVKEVLYIQMEFCEKNTLRQAIDNGLFQEHFRAWRLFREIVEGLAHVHQRGMIHRDLKPVNIFLDSNDHVKIGDFGLATKAFGGLPIEDKSKPEEEIGGSLTGQVGTALYVAPELLQAAGKVIYNQKVDIYSLGIILFEMFHQPHSTAMERIIMLNDLRTIDIIMPKHFQIEENSKQIHVIRWLLNHDASARPTCVELLASEHVPRPVPEGALSGLLAHTLNDRGSRSYQRLITACLDQRLPAAEDITYHGELKSKPEEILDALKDVVIKVFKKHGATKFSPPLLTPRSKCWDEYPNAVRVMTSSGAVCHLPYNLRLPFARHIAYTGTKFLRRYLVDKVYREKHQGFHPKEINECVFDMVAPKPDFLWSDAELLLVGWRCAMTCSLKVILHLNHTELLKVLLRSCGVPLDKQADLYPVLVGARLGRITNLQVKTHLTSLCVTDRDVSNLLDLMKAEVDSIQAVRELVAPLVPAKWSKALTQALAELEAVFENAKALGCKCQMMVAPFLALHATQHSGVFWQMSVVRPNDNRSSAKHHAADVIAAGGRYDSLVQEFYKVANDNADLKCSSVGFSLSLERIAAILKKMDTELPTVINNSESTLICVCFWGTPSNDRAAARSAALAKHLWDAEYNCCCCASSRADAHELSKAAMVLEQDDGIVRVSHRVNDSVREYKVSALEILYFVQQKLNADTVRSPESAGNRSISYNENDKSSSPHISVTFITVNDKLTKNTKRNSEQQINTQLTSTLISLGLQPLLGRVRVRVFALACEAKPVRALAAQLALPLDEHDLMKAAQILATSFPKHQDIIDRALEELAVVAKQSNQSRNQDETQLYALYSINDSLCRLIT